VKLFDRSAKYPKPTGEGEALLLEAEAVIGRMDGFKARARTMAQGLEPELAAVVDVMYPMAALTRAVGFFTQTYPRTPLRLYVEALGAVVQAVPDGRSRIGVIGSLLVLTDRSTLSEGRRFAVFSPLIRRLADFGAKLEFLRAGFGWGHMPLPMVEDVLAAKHLVKAPRRRQACRCGPCVAQDAPPGPAGRAFIQPLRNY
jgi:DNA-binding transcriptional LysR family regulator